MNQEDKKLIYQAFLNREVFVQSVTKKKKIEWKPITDVMKHGVRGKDQYKIAKAVNMLMKAGYTHKDITVFMICNWKIPQEDCLKKMDLCKVWRVKVSDCYFDNQLSPNIKPIHWTAQEIKDFRKRVRKHNQLVVFGIDPEIKKTEELQNLLLF